MAQLIKAIQNNNVFANAQEIDTILEQRNNLVNGMFAQIRIIVD